MRIFDFFANIFANREKLTDRRFDNASLERLKRRCWLPEVSNGDGGLTASKFSGIPYLSARESWRICPNCQNPIQLFVQINSEDLPDESGKPWGDGLLQFFYCTNREHMCDIDCEAWRPFSRSTLLRVIVPEEDRTTFSESPVNDEFPAKQIVGWNERDDFPNCEEITEYDIEIPESIIDKLGETYPRYGEKLLGWPAWVQGIEYPQCPKCDSRMKLIFQIDSDKNIPFAFGDVGIGHISQCPVHLTELGFGWACS